MSKATMLFTALLAAGLTAACAGNRPFVSYDEPHATLVTQKPVHNNPTSVFFLFSEDPGSRATLISRNLQPGQKLYPVNLLQVDANNVNDPQLSYTIEPGEHEVVLAPVIDVDAGLMASVKTRRYDTPKLKVNFEPGKRYFLGAVVEGHRTDDWKPVVWKVEG